jgi:hypothetical protein
LLSLLDGEKITEAHKGECQKNGTAEDQPGSGDHPETSKTTKKDKKRSGVKSKAHKR